MAQKQAPPRFTSKWGVLHYSSFSFSLLNNLSAISVPSLIGSVLCPISFVANTSAESLMKSMSVIGYHVKATMTKAQSVPKGKTNANCYCYDVALQILPPCIFRYQQSIPIRMSEVREPRKQPIADVQGSLLQFLSGNSLWEHHLLPIF